jgi:hypothetical protein
MARLVLEVYTRGFHEYHKLDKFPVTLGRAFDNDIILSDLSVSPHHAVILEDDDGFKVHNLSTENGSRLNKVELDDKPASVSLPAHLEMGHQRTRLLSPDMPVDKTRIRECTGFFCLYTSAVWAIFLLVATLGIFLFDQLLQMPMTKGIGYYINSSFNSILLLIAFFLVFAGISRLATHRWDLVPAISMASLLLLIPQLAQYTGHFLNYLLTRDFPLDILLNLANFLTLPILLMIYMMRINHSPWLQAIGVSLLVSSPFMAWQSADFVQQITRPDFSPSPDYNQTLSSMDIRLSPSINMEDFILQAQEDVSDEVAKELEKYESE